MRLTGLLTNTHPGGLRRQLADLELHHRRHARVEDRIRTGKDTGLRNLSFHDLAQTRSGRHRRAGRFLLAPNRVTRLARPRHNLRTQTISGCTSWP
jgi:hypothetical protein